MRQMVWEGTCMPYQPPLDQPPLDQPPLFQPPLFQPPLFQPPLDQPPLVQSFQELYASNEALMWQYTDLQSRHLGVNKQYTELQSRHQLVVQELEEAQRKLQGLLAKTKRTPIAPPKATAAAVAAATAAANSATATAAVTTAALVTNAATTAAVATAAAATAAAATVAAAATDAAPTKSKGTWVTVAKTPQKHTEKVQKKRSPPKAKASQKSAPPKAQQRESTERDHKRDHKRTIPMGPEDTIFSVHEMIREFAIPLQQKYGPRAKIAVNNPIGEKPTITIRSKERAVVREIVEKIHECNQRPDTRIVGAEPSKSHLKNLRRKQRRRENREAQD